MQRRALAGVAALAFLLGGIAAGLVGYVGALSDAAVGDTFSDVPVTSRVFELAARVADDADAQDSAALEAFDRYVGEAPYDVHRSLLTEPRQLLDPEAPDDDDAAEGLPRVALAAYSELAEHAELVAGEWPDVRDGGPVAAAVHADAAAQHDIDVGDLLVFEERLQVSALIVTGLWRPIDAADEYWFGNPLEADGSDDRADGLVVLDESALLTLPGSDPVVRWRLEPDAEAMTAADLGVLRLGLPRIRPFLADDPLFRDAGIAVADDMIAGLQGTDSALLAARSVAIAPLLLGGVAAIGTIAILSRLLAELRLHETLLLRGRGWSRAQTTTWALREALATYVVPAALGGIAGYGVLRATLASDLDVPPDSIIGAVVVVIAAGLIVMTAAGARMAVPAHTAVASVARTSRRQILGRLGALVILAAVAVLATWQLRRFDGVTVLDSRGIRQLDPLAVAAPAALLLAAAVLVAGLIVVVGRVVEWVLQRLRGLSGVHAARSLGRQPAAYVLPVVLVGLAAGGGTFAAAYTSTWQDLQGEVAAERTAADIDIRTGASGLMTRTIEPLVLDEFEDVDGVTGAEAAVTRAAQLSDGAVTLVGASGAGERANGLAIPAGASNLQLDLTTQARLYSEALEEDSVDGGDGQPLAMEGRISIWLADDGGSGGVIESPLVFTSGDSESHAAEVALPEPGRGQWRILGFDIWVDTPAIPQWQVEFGVTIETVRVDGSAITIADDGWSAHNMRTPDQNPYTLTTPGGLSAELTGDLSFFTFSGTDVLSFRLAHGGDVVPVTASSAALETFGLAVGDTATLDVLGTQLPVEIADVTDSVAGSGQPEAFAADLNALISAVFMRGSQPPAPDRIWLATDPDAPQGEIADAAASLAGADSTVLARSVVESELADARLAQLIVTVFWVISGVAAGLAIIAVWAGSASSLGSRTAEVAVFRALGLSAAQQARQRRRELLLLGLLAMTFGGLAGYVTSLVAVPPLAGSATPGLPDTVEPLVRVAWPGLAVFAVLVVAALLMIGIGHSATVRRQAAALRGIEVAP